MAVSGWFECGVRCASRVLTAVFSVTFDAVWWCWLLELRFGGVGCGVDVLCVGMGSLGGGSFGHGFGFVHLGVGCLGVGWCSSGMFGCWLV